MLTEVTDATFEEQVIEQSKKGEVVIVDYYSNSCAPCSRLMPKLENVQQRSPDAKIVKVNIENNIESSIRNAIRTIPTLVVYKNGEAFDIHRGCSQLSEDAIEKLLVV